MCPVHIFFCSQQDYFWGVLFWSLVFLNVLTWFLCNVLISASVLKKKIWNRMMSWQCSRCIIAVWTYRFVCLLWLKFFIQVEVYWFQEPTVADLLRRTRCRESKFHWYFSKHFLYKMIYRRIINLPVLSFTVNFPRPTCCCWTGTRAMYQTANEKRRREFQIIL